MQLSRVLVRLAAALLAAQPWAAGAGTLEVAPVTHELAAEARHLGLTVTNRGSLATTLQVRGFVWTQEHGEDRLAPAPELLFSPAIVRIEPGKTQIVRAMFSDGSAPHERSYRMLIDELPAAEAAEPVRFALRLSIPVFRQGRSPAPAQLRFELSPDGSSLLASNLGGRRERVRELALGAADGSRAVPVEATGPYLLPGARRSWRVSNGALGVAAGQPLILTALTDAGRIELPLGAAP
jgi:fimbrial chaperone protein